MSDQKINSILSFALLATPISTQVNESLSKKAPSQIESSSPRASHRKFKQQLAISPKLEPMGTYVGELQEKWKFPSDHLPIAMAFENLNFLSWNVMDAVYMNWVIEKNSQGLSRSQLVDEHIYIGDSKLTIRDRHVAELILETVTHPTHSREILSLQECSEAFLQELRSKLPSNFEIVSHLGDAVVIDKRRVELIESKGVSGVFADAPYRTFQDLSLRRLDNGQTLRILNAHLPGDPTKPGRDEFANYIKSTLDPTVTTLAMGDMNFNELEMASAFNQAFPNGSPFSIHSPYCTNISPFVFTSKAIDHFFIYSPNQSQAALHAPREIMTGLEPIVDLLAGKAPKDEIIDFVKKNCLNEGTLQKTREYVYLTLNQEYLSQVFGKIKENNPDVLPPRFKGGIGPHISILRHDEWKGTPPSKIAELGARYLFTPVRIDVIQTAHKRLWTLVVKPSPELATLREKYAVGGMPHGHEFHITLAQQPI